MRPLPIREVVPGATVDGPVAELAEAVRELQVRLHEGAAPPPVTPLLT